MQIAAKGDGDAQLVQAYIAAMPGVEERLRRLGAGSTRSSCAQVPAGSPRSASKAVRWNSPWWGVEGQGWFVSEVGHSGGLSLATSR